MKWIDNDRVGSMVDVGFTCTIRMCDNKYDIIDWYQEDGIGSYLLVGHGEQGAWTLVSICTVRDRSLIPPSKPKNKEKSN
jgi:hypothetical protein